MEWRTTLCLFIFTTVYILGGAYVFMLLEAEAGKEVISAAACAATLDIASTQFFQDFLAAHPNVTAGELRSFVTSVTAVQGMGGVADSNVNGSTDTCRSSDSYKHRWTFDNAVLYTVSIITTIGYGHLSLRTTGGKLFCVIYTLIGVPAGAAQLACVGRYLRRVLVVLHHSKPWYLKDRRKDQMLKSLVALGCGTVLMLLLPAALWVVSEQWDYATAVYYSTITLTTVGFGDYVAGLRETEWAVVYRIGLSLWLITGLSWVALIISEIGDIYINCLGRSRSTKRKTEATRRTNCTRDSNDRTLTGTNCMSDSADRTLTGTSCLCDSNDRTLTGTNGMSDSTDRTLTESAGRRF